MIFDSPDIHLIAPADASRIPGAIASGSIAVRYDDARDGPFVARECSGFRISRLHVLTAAHCVGSDLVFDHTYLAASTATQTLRIAPSVTTVRVVFDGETLSSDQVLLALPLLGAPLYRSPTLDFAVFALPAPSSSFVDLAAISTAPEPEGLESEELLVYGYPNGAPLSVSSCCRSAPSPLKDLLLHDCDTLPGSSGALLVSASTGLGVALHSGNARRNDLATFEATGHFESPTDVHATICDPPSDPPAPEPTCFEGPGYNTAIKLTAVVRELRRRAPSVWRSILQESRICSPPAA